MADTPITNAAQSAAPQSSPQVGEKASAADPKVKGALASAEAPKAEGQAAEAKKFKIFKQKGQEVEVSEEDYHRYAQKSWAADQRLSEAKKRETELEQRDLQIRHQQSQIEQMKKMKPSQRVMSMLEELQDDPEAMKDFRGSVEQFLLQKIEEESASPELQRALKAEREAEKYKKDKENFEKNQKAEAWKKSVAENRPLQEKAIIDTLKISGLPPTEWNVKHTADLMFAARQKGHKPTPEQIASILKEDRIDNIRAVGNDFSTKIIEANGTKDYATVMKLGDQLAELYGEDILKALRFYDLRKHLSGQPELPTKPVETQKTAEEKKAGAYEYKTMDEWQDARRKLVASMQK